MEIPSNHIYNAYLLSGLEQEVLLDAALRFAEVILSNGRKDVRIPKLEHPDLILLKPDIPKTQPRGLSVDNVRQNLVDTISERPYEAPYKIYLIPAAESLNASAQNALLKTLEEPPEYAVIILMAASSEGFLPTIRSRVIEFKAPEPDPGRIMDRLLQEDWGGKVLDFLREITFHSTAEFFELMKQLENVEIPDLLIFLEIMFRNALLCREGGEADYFYGQGTRETVQNLSSLPLPLLGKIIDLILEAERSVSLNLNRDLFLENFFFTIKEGMNG